MVWEEVQGMSIPNVFIPMSRASKIQILLYEIKLRDVSESQLTKDLLIKGWSYESAENIAYFLKRLQLREVQYRDCDTIYSDLCKYYLGRKRPCNYGRTHGVYCPYAGVQEDLK